MPSTREATEGASVVAVDRVLLAAPRSFCAGVDMAIKALAWMVRTFDPPVYCYHEIVHNRLVIDRFRDAGVVFVDAIDEVPPGAPLMLSAHGSAPEVVRSARARSPLVVDAVCPLVKKVHHELKQRADKGHIVLYAGHQNHDETMGALGVAPAATHLVESPADVAAIDGVDSPVAFLAQTTLGLDEWQGILEAARERFGSVWLPGRSDLCFATTNRQAAVRAMAPRCDAVVVVGSATSANTRVLAKVARASMTRAASGHSRVVRIDGPDELPPDLRGTIGITAGASAAEEVVQSVVNRLAPRHGIEVVDVTAEDEYFPPPRDLRELLRSRGAERLLDADASVAASDVLRQLPRPRKSRSTDVGELLAIHASRIDRQISALVDQEIADPWLRGAIGYHLGWLDERFEPPAAERRSGGKKFRATLAVLAYQATVESDAASRPNGDIDRVVPFAAAIELLHNWILIHDDIEDGDRTRRGRPALWALCGEAKAINVGDCVFALAFSCLGRLRMQGVAESQVAALTSEVCRAAVELTVGQMRDLAFETIADIGTERYMEMIEGKAAALIGCATYGGALLGSGEPARARAFARFGRRLGLSFQMRDDILGIWGVGAQTGKPTGGDIRRRKKSLPVVVGLERAEGPDGVRFRQLYARKSPLAPDEEEYVRQVLDRCGAQEIAQAYAERHRAEALTALADAVGEGDQSPRAGSAFAALRALTDFVTERTH